MLLGAVGRRGPVRRQAPLLLLRGFHRRRAFRKGGEGRRRKGQQDRMKRRGGNRVVREWMLTLEGITSTFSALERSCGRRGTGFAVRASIMSLVNLGIPSCSRSIQCPRGVVIFFRQTPPYFVFVFAVRPLFVFRVVSRISSATINIKTFLFSVSANTNT